MPVYSRFPASAYDAHVMRQRSNLSKYRLNPTDPELGRIPPIGMFSVRPLLERQDTVKINVPGRSMDAATLKQGGLADLLRSADRASYVHQARTERLINRFDRDLERTQQKVSALDERMMRYAHPPRAVSEPDVSTQAPAFQQQDTLRWFNDNRDRYFRPLPDPRDNLVTGTRHYISGYPTRLYRGS